VLASAEGHQAACAAMTRAAKKTLKLMQADAAEANEAREADMAAALAALAGAHSEVGLDEKVAAALSCLTAIERGHRDASSAAVGVAAAHPSELRKAHDAQRDAMCAMLGVAPQAEHSDVTQGGIVIAARSVDVPSGADHGTATPPQGDHAASVHLPELTACGKRWQRRRDVYLELLSLRPVEMKPERSADDIAEAPAPAQAAEEAGGDASGPESSRSGEPADAGPVQVGTPPSA
jgi:Domain of unknown function (DUF4455)